MATYPRSQASVTNPTDAEQMKRLFKLIDWFEKKTGWRSRFPNTEASRLVRFTMDRKATKPTKEEFLRVIEGRPFSYAIIGADPKGLNYNHFQKLIPWS